MTALEFVAVMGAIATGAAGLITAIQTSKASATKAQFDALSDVIKLLQSDNTRIIAENKRLMERIENLECELEERDGTLEQIKQWAELLVGELKKHDIPVPPMPEKTKPIIRTH